MTGLSGSGKSFKAKSLVESEDQIASADKFFIGEDGSYNFDPKLLGQAHKSCKEHAERLMKTGVDVVIDNTNTTLKERKPHLDLAKRYGYDAKFVVPDTPWAFDVDECTKRNSHGVPREAIQQMKDRFVHPYK